MIAGVSTACFYPMHTEEALKELIRLGVRDVEIFFNAADEINGTIYKVIEALVKENSISVHSVHPFTSALETVYLFSDYDRRVEEIMELYKRYFEIMNSLGAKIFVLHGALASAICSDEFYFEQYSRLYRLGKQFGVTVAQENICYCKSKSLDFLRKMSAQLGDECAFVLDLKQAHRSDISPFEIMDELGGKIRHYHVSDYLNRQADCLPAGKGGFDFDIFFRRLADEKYSGAVMLELYRKNFGESCELADSLEFLHKGIEKISKIT